jgi:hypothetical protein
MPHLGGGWLGGSLAERGDAHQHHAARACASLDQLIRSRQHRRRDREAERLRDPSPPFRFGSRSLVLIAAKGDSMSVLVASEIPWTRG